MGTNISGTPGGSGSVYLPPEVGGTVPLPTGSLPTDQLSVADPFQALVNQYLQDITNPQLVAPGTTALIPSQYFSAQFVGQQQFLFNTQQLPINTQANNAFNQSFNNALNQQGQQLNLSQDEMAQVRYAFYHPDDPNIPQDLKELAAQIAQSSLNEVREQFDLPQDWGVEPDTQAFDNAVQDLSTSLFNDNLMGYALQNDLSPEDVAKIVYALNHPEDTNIDPKIKQYLADVKALVKADLTQQFDLPSTLPEQPPNTEMFDQLVAADYDAGVEAAINQYAQDNDLPPGMAERMIFMHYNPDAEVPPPAEGMPDLSAILKDIEQQVSVQVKKDNGLPDSYPMKANQATYKAMVMGTYAGEVRSQIQNYQGEPPLSEEEKQILFQAAMDPDSINVPPNLKEILRAIREKAISNTEKLFKIPAGQFKPDPQFLAGLNFTQPPATAQAKNALDQGFEILRAMKDMARLMPDGPDKQAFGDYLMAVHTALNKLRQMLYEMEMFDSSKAQEMSRMNLQLAQDKIAYQKQQMDKMKNQKPKGGLFGKIASFFQKLGILGTILSFVMLGPIGGTFMLLNEKFGLIDKLFSAIGEVVAAICEKMGMGEKAVSAIKAMVKIVVIAAMASMMIASGNGMLVVMQGPQMLTESGLIQDVVMVFAKNKMAAEITAMAITAAIGVAVMIGMMLIPIPGANAAAVAAQVGNVVKMVGQFVAKVMEFIGNVVQMALKAVKIVEDTVAFGARLSQNVVKLTEKLANFISSIDINKIMGAVDKVNAALTLAQQAVQVDTQITAAINAFRQSAVERMRGEMEGTLELIEGLIQHMKKILASMLDALMGIGEQINDITTLVGKLYEQASQDQSQLFNVPVQG